MDGELTPRPSTQENAEYQRTSVSRTLARGNTQENAEYQRTSVSRTLARGKEVNQRHFAKKTTPNIQTNDANRTRATHHCTEPQKSPILRSYRMFARTHKIAVFTREPATRAQQRTLTELRQRDQHIVDEACAIKRSTATKLSSSHRAALRANTGNTVLCTDRFETCGAGFVDGLQTPPHQAVDLCLACPHHPSPHPMPILCIHPCVSVCGIGSHRLITSVLSLQTPQSPGNSCQKYFLVHHRPDFSLFLRAACFGTEMANGASPALRNLVHTEESVRFAARVGQS